MKVLYWGTPAYAVAGLEALVAAGHELVGVVSQPDRRRGRGNALQPSPMKARALELDIPVLTPERIRRDPEAQARLAALGADVYVVVAFGQILPPEVLAQPPMGCWNGHGSMLPRWRGAAPIQWALIEGDTETGVGIMAMEEGLDTGPVLLERSLAIGLLENADELGERLAALTAALLVEALPRIEAAGAGAAPERLLRLGVQPQTEEGLTYARLLTKQDFLIDWQGTALQVHRKVMGLYPGATTTWQGKRLKLLTTEPLLPQLADRLSPEGAALATHSDRSPPCRASGTVLAVVDRVGVVVATAEGELLVRRAQLEGRTASEGGALVQQLGASQGDRFGR